MNNRDLEILFDIALDFKTDKAKIAKISKEVEEVFSQIKPDIDINDKAIKQTLASVSDMLTTGKIGASELAEVFNSFGFDMNNEKVLASLNEISQLAEEIADEFEPLEDVFDNIDTKKFEDAFSKLSESMEGIDADEFGSAVQALADNYDKVTREAQELINTNKKAMATLKANGDEGSEAYNKLQREIDEAERELKKLDGTLDSIDTKKLHDAFSSLIDKPLDKVGTEEYGNAVQALADNYDKVTKEAQELIDTNKKAMATLKANGMESTDAYKKLQKEIDGAERELEQLGAKASETSSIIEKMSTFGMAVHGIEQITNTLQRFQEPFIELDAQVRNIGTLGVKNFQEFADAATQLSRKVPDSAGAIAQGVYEAISAGTMKVNDGIADLNEGMKFVETASKLATAGLTDTQSAINGLTSILNAYKLETGDAEYISDVMFNTVNAGKVSVTELNSSLARIVPTSAALGVTFDQLGGALATMTKQGVPAQMAATKLNQVLVELQKPGTELKRIMGEAGVSLESLRMEGLQESLKKLGEVMEKEGKTAATYFGSVEAAAAINLLSGANAKMAAEDFKFVASEMGTTEAAFAISSEGIGNKTKLMINNIQASFNGLMGIIGEVGQTALAATTQLAPLVTSFAGLANLIPDSAFEKLKTFKFSLAGLSGQATQSAGILGKMGGLAMNPWVLGTAAAAAGMYLFLTKTEKGQAILKRWGEAGERILNTLQPVINALSDLGETTLAVLIDIGENIFDLLITPFEMAFDIIGSFIETILELVGASDNAGGAMTTFAGIINFVGDVISGVGYLFDMYTLAIKTASDLVVGYVKTLPELLSIAYEYLTYYLNPKNWIAGDAEYEAALGERLMNAIDSVTGKAKDRLTDAKIDRAIENALEIKGDLDKNNQLEELVKKYEATTDEIAKRDIAQEIAKKMPEAVTGYKTVIDENGKLVEVMDVSIEKVKEFAVETKKALTEDLKSEKSAFTEVLQSKAKEYDLLAQKAEELAQKIVQGQMKGQDTSEFEKQYNEFQKKLIDKSRDISKVIAEGNRIGLEFDTITLPENVEKDFQDELERIRDEIKNAKFDELLSDVFAVKGDIVKQEDVDKLVEKYNQATDEITRNSIAEKLKEVAPEAVKQVGVIQDAEGKLTKQYEVQTGKIKESAAAQKKRLTSDMISRQMQYISNLQSEADLYAQGKDKLDALLNEINEKQKQGIDTTELEKQYDALFEKLKGDQEQLLDWAQKAIGKGVSQDRIFQTLAKALNLPIEKIKEMIEKQDKSKKKTEEQVKAVDSLAEAWNKARQSVSNAMNEQLAQTNQLYLEMQKETDAVKKQELKKQYDESLTALKGQVKEKKALDRIDETTQRRAGLIVEQGKTALERAKENASLKIQMLEYEQKQYEFAQKEAILAQGRNVEEADMMIMRQKSIDTLNAQKQIWEDMLTDKTKLKMKEADEQEVKKNIQDLNQKLQDETQNLIALQLKLKLEDEDIQNQVKELERQKIEYDISIGIKDEDAFQSIIDEYEAKLQTLPASVKASNDKIVALNEEMEQKITETKTEEEKKRIELAYHTKINAERENNIKLQQELLSLTQTIANYQTKQQEAQMSRIKDDEAKQLEMIRRRMELERAYLDKFNSEYIAAANKRYSELRTEDEQALSKKEETKLKELESLKKSELISAENYEKRKTKILQKAEEERWRIAKEYANKSANLESLAKGRSIALENEKAIEEAKVLEKSLQDQVDIYKKKKLAGTLSVEDNKALELLEAQLEEAKDIIKEKGELLNIGAKLLGESLSSSLTQMFAGDKEGAAKSLQDFFITMSGIMIKGLTDYINKIVLEWVLNMLQMSPADPVSKLFLAPGFHALISGVVNAIAQPLLTPISFATGGMVTSPTLAVVGDSAKLGESNTEWIFRHSQLIALIQMAAASSNAMLINRLERLENVIASQQLTTTLKGSDIHIALRRVAFNNQMRSI